MSTLRRTAHNLGSLMGAKLVARATGLVLTAALARHLGGERYGEYNLAISFAAMFAVISKMGVHTIILRDVAGRRELGPKYLGTSISLVAVQSVALLVVVGLAAWILGYEGQRWLGIMVMAVSFAGASFEALGYTVFEAHERMHFESAFILLRQAFWIGLVVAGLMIHEGYLYFVWSQAITGIVMPIVGFWAVQRWFFRFRPEWDSKTARLLWSGGLPLAISTILVDLYLRTDVVMLDRMTDAATVGLYSAAFRLVTSVTFLANSFYTAIFPVFSRMEIEATDRLAWAYDQSTRFITMALVPLCVVVTFESELITRVVFGEEFLASHAVLALSIWTTALQGIAVVSGRILVTKRRENLILWISAVSLMTNVGLNLLMIPRMGMLGASVASVITQSLVSMLTWAVAAKMLERSRLLVLLMPVAAAALGMSAVMWVLRDFHPLLVAPAGLVGFFAVLRVTGGFGPQELGMLRTVLRR